MSKFQKTVGIYTLGCKVNQYESEAIAEAFASKGFAVASPSSVCDVYVINTCTVTAESDRKARQFIRRAIHNNPTAFILVTGCMAQTSAEQIASIAGVDYVCGNANKLSVVEEALKLCERGEKNNVPQISALPPDANGFEKMCISKFDRTRAYIKIEDGCENRCTYCIIPSARGSVRSKSPEDILNEVSLLTRGGCREIVLTGIETASYGKDLNGYGLADLLEEIDSMQGIGRIRLGSLDPSLMKQPFVDRIAKLKSLTPHFHLSMQSGSDRILALMKRKYNRKMALEGMERLRRAIPDVQFTTDMIVGFPQESEEDFAQTVSFAKEARFLMIHVFPYSKRVGTVAAQMSSQVPEAVKHERVKLLSAVQEEIRKEILASYTDTVQEVLFETYSNGTVFGHTASFVEVCCPCDSPLNAELHKVKILQSDASLCVGTLYHEA